MGRLTSLSLLVSLALPLAGAARRDDRLADAVERRDIDRVDLLLRSGADGDTALHLAASLGLTSVVRLLVERGARLETRNKRGQTALGAALAEARLARGASAPYALPHEDSEAMAKLLSELGARD